MSFVTKAPHTRPPGQGIAVEISGGGGGGGVGRGWLQMTSALHSHKEHRH